ncbi:MAG: 50S ribosomal protein L24 [Candidatus Babeliales bacterium]
MERIKKNDTIVVISGKDKGKKGEIIEILPKKGKVLVKGVALVTKHYKARKQGEKSGIKKIESYIDSSNIMPICPSCGKPARVGAKEVESGKRLRVCKQCNENF